MSEHDSECESWWSVFCGCVLRSQLCNAERSINKLEAENERLKNHMAAQKRVIEAAQYEANKQTQIYKASGIGPDGFMAILQLLATLNKGASATETEEKNDR